MKRAIDLSLKHTYLAHDVQKAEGTPFVGYLELEEVSQPATLLALFKSSSQTSALHCLHAVAVDLIAALGPKGPAGAPGEQVDPSPL